jgi:hypothetical protein
VGVPAKGRRVGAYKKPRARYPSPKREIVMGLPIPHLLILLLPIAIIVIVVVLNGRRRPPGA